MSFWAVEWHSRNLLDGEARHLQWEWDVRLYRTRRACREFIEERYGYIRTRPDLKAEPHGWRMSRAVKVVVRKSMVVRKEPPPWTRRVGRW